MSEVRGVRILLKQGCVDEARAWAKEIGARENEALESLLREGIVLEAAFLDRVGEDDYLVYIMKGDLEGSKAVAATSVAAIDAMHAAFKKACWKATSVMEPMVWLESKRND